MSIHRRLLLLARKYFFLIFFLIITVSPIAVNADSNTSPTPSSVPNASGPLISPHLSPGKVIMAVIFAAAWVSYFLQAAWAVRKSITTQHTSGRTLLSAAFQGDNALDTWTFLIFSFVLALILPTAFLVRELLTGPNADDPIAISKLLHEITTGVLLILILLEFSYVLETRARSIRHASQSLFEPWLNLIASALVIDLGMWLLLCVLKEIIITTTYWNPFMATTALTSFISSAFIIVCVRKLP